MPTFGQVLLLKSGGFDKAAYGVLLSSRQPAVVQRSARAVKVLVRVADRCERDHQERERGQESRGENALLAELIVD